MDAVQKPAAALAYFDLSPGGFPWRDPRPQQIERRRAELGDLLLFDILLTSGGIRQPDTLYPPVDVDTFHRLLDAIQTSEYDALKKDCLVYFLLKWYQDGREERFNVERCIPPQFARLADAYWHLDAGVNVPRAVSILSDTRLNADYASKILQAISLAPNPMPLVLKYVRTAKPLLTEPDDIDLYTVALAESSLLEAWQFQRTFNEKNETRSRLLKKILDWCFTPAPRRNALVQLLSIALTPYEQSLMQSYATPPSALPSVGIALLQNLICVRLIQTGKYADAIKVDRQFSASSVGMGSQTTERTKMVQEVYAALPLAERMILDAEPDNPGVEPSASNKTIMNGSPNLDVTMSWEDLRPPVPAPAPAAITPLPPLTITPASELPAFANGGSHELFRSKFGGFGGSQPTSAFAPLSSSTSSSSRTLAPIIPVTSVPKGNLSAQPAIPSTRPPLINAFSSLSQSTSRFGGSPGSGVTSVFDSAGRKQNAFYQPSRQPPTPAPIFNEVDVEDTSKTKSAASPEDTDIEVDEDVVEPAHEAREDDSLSYSVFGGKSVRSGTRTRTRTRASAPEDKQVPPGAFASDDEPEVQEPPPPPPPTRQTRRSTAASHKTEPAKPAKTTRTRARAKEPELSRSLPGSLMASEDGSADEAEEEEEREEVAPLPPRRKAAAVAAVTEGVQTRRRSTRLNSAEAENRIEKEKGPSKMRAAPTGRKRRA